MSIAASSYPAHMRPATSSSRPKKISNSGTPNYMATANQDYGSFAPNNPRVSKLNQRLRLVERKIINRVQTTHDLIGLVRRVRLNDGKWVTPLEFHKVLVKLGIYVSKEDSDQIFATFDSDRSGSIDPEEFATWVMCSDFAKEINTKSRFAKHETAYTKIDPNHQPRYMSSTRNPSKMVHNGTIAWQSRNAKIAAMDTRRTRMATIRAAHNVRPSTSQQHRRNLEIKDKQDAAFKWGSAPSSAERRLLEALRQSYESLEKMAMKIMKYDVYIDERQLFRIINLHAQISQVDFDLILTSLKRDEYNRIEWKSFEKKFSPLRNVHAQKNHGNLRPVPVGLATTVLTPIDTSQDIALPRRVGTAPAHTTRPRYHRIGQIFDYDHPDLGY